MKLEQNGSVKKNGRVRRVPLTDPRKCPDCDGVGWPAKLNSPGDIVGIDWDWPCQTCDTEGVVEGEVLDLLG